MRHFLLLAMILATIAVPLWLARDPRPARGYRRLRWSMFAITIAWALLLRWFYFRL